MWKKILYLGVAFVIGILVFIMSYSSNQMNHLESLIRGAIENEKFHEVPMVWDGCFDTKSIVKNDQENLDIVIYPATSQTDITLTIGEESNREVEYEKAYYVYIFNAKFSLGNINDGSTNYNETCLEFSNENNTSSYKYYFVVNEEINKGSYVAEPTTLAEALLNNSRDVTNTNEIWNFMRVTLTETMLNQITSEIGGEVAKLDLKDSDGNVQYSTDIELDFSQPFFTDVKPLFDNYNIYLDSYLAADGDKTKIQEASDKFQEFYEPWKVEFDKNENGYTFRYEDSILTPSKLMWQTVGMVALYAVVIVLFYILLFHFSTIRKIFSRETYKDYSEDSEVMVNGKMVKRNKEKQQKDVIVPVEEIIKPDTVMDYSLETVTAGDVISQNTDEALDEVKTDTPSALEEKILTDVKVEEAIIEPSNDEEEKVASVEESVLEKETVVEENKEKSKKTPVKKPATKKAASTEEKKAEPKKASSTKSPSKKVTGTTQKKTTSSKATTSTTKTSTKKTSTSKTVKENSDEAN
ncbi:MAG: hypothetical protein K2N64_04645 [Anaeroplasmataceae bacterium]|nr:hypothetical protein [Anaeroplasmataceae bacterium]